MQTTKFHKLVRMNSSLRWLLIVDLGNCNVLSLVMSDHVTFRDHAVVASVRPLS